MFFWRLFIMEIFCLVKQKASPLYLVAQIAVILAGVAVFLYVPSLLSPLAIVAGIAVSIFIGKLSKVEYETSYFDGEVRFAKIINMNSRKELTTYLMSEVETIAKAGSRSVYRYENDRNVKVFDYTSREKNVPYYDLIVRKNSQTMLYKVELDERFLEAVAIKYSMKIAK